MFAVQREGGEERDGESPLAVWGLGQEGRGGERRYVAVVVGL